MSKVFSIAEIQSVLGKKGIFAMLDRAEKIDDTHFAAIKLISINETYFLGHFPGHPIMPGVLQLEAMRQLAELALRPTLDPEKKQDIYLRRADKVRFRRPVNPGDRIKIEIEITGKDEAGATLVKGTVSTAAGLASQANMTIDLRPRVWDRGMPEFPNENDFRPESIKLDVNGIMNAIPHRYPFLLADYISKFDGDAIIATKNLTINEPFFVDAPAEFPVLPEAFLCEIAAQIGCSFVLSSEANRGKIGVFMGIDQAESFAPVGAGDQLVFRSMMPPTQSKFGKGGAEVFCDGKLVFRTMMMFALVDA